VLLSKLDLVEPERLAELRSEFEAEGHTVMAASAVTGEGINPLIFALADALKSLPKDDG
jgi:selenocysteine-specific translation elongation factor